MCSVDRDWLEDVFFHDSIEQLQRKHEQMITVLLSNPLMAQAKEFIVWMETTASADWPEETDDKRVILVLNLLSRFRELQSHIPFSPRMARELEFICGAFDAFYSISPFGPTKVEFANFHHLYHFLAIHVAETTVVPVPNNLKLYNDSIDSATTSMPIKDLFRLADAHKEFEKQRQRLSRLYQPCFFDDLQHETSKLKRKQDSSSSHAAQLPRESSAEYSSDSDDNVFDEDIGPKRLRPSDDRETDEEGVK